MTITALQRDFRKNTTVCRRKSITIVACMRKDDQKSLMRSMMDCTSSLIILFRLTKHFLIGCRFQRLQALEHKHPSLLSHHSPSVQINVPFVDQDKRLLVNHLVPMLGLKNAYDNDDLARFWKSTQKKTHSDVMELEEHEKHNGKNDLQIAGGMVCEMKYDGIAVALRYRNGRFVSAATRGDGQRGHSITQHCESVDDIPKQLEAAPKEVEIRGELVITREHYGAMRKLTRTSSDNGGEAEISSRNFIAGLLHRKQASPEVLRSLSFVAYEAMASGRTGEDWHLSHNERMQLLSQSGFRTCQRRTLVHSFQDALTFIARQEDTTASLLFYCDGIVLKVNDIRLREALGSTQRHPRWAIAYKFEGGTAITRVVGVEASVGRSGKVTPVALLEPVSIGAWQKDSSILPMCWITSRSVSVLLFCKLLLFIAADVGLRLLFFL